MKYRAIVDIPEEEIIDGRLDCTINYMSVSPGEEAVTAKTATGQLEPHIVLSDDAVELVHEHIEDGDVIMFRFGDELLPDDLMMIKEMLSVEFPNNKVVGLTKDVDALISSPKEAIEMLEKMIAKIKILNV